MSGLTGLQEQSSSGKAVSMCPICICSCEKVFKTKLIWKKMYCKFYQITFTQDHLYIQTLPITDSITNYLTTRSTNLARWDVSLQPYLKYLSVALYINYLPLWNTQKVQEERLKWKCWLVLVSNVLKKKKKKLFIFTSKICIICILLQIISSSCMIYRPAAYNRLRASR